MENSGISLGGLLLVVFIVLKLCGVIHWGWLWVLSPVWVPLLVGVVVFAILWVIGVAWSIIRVH